MALWTLHRNLPQFIPLLCNGEYYLYDPDRGDLSGWLRTEDRLDVIEPMLGWVSPRLGVRFEMSGYELQLFRPDGERFATYVELAALREQAQQQLEQERLAKEQAQQQLEQERSRSTQLADKLRELGINPDELK